MVETLPNTVYNYSMKDDIRLLYNLTHTWPAKAVAGTVLVSFTALALAHPEVHGGPVQGPAIPEYAQTAFVTTSSTSATGSSILKAL